MGHPEHVSLQVANAEAAQAEGLLVYPDPSDIPQDPRKLGLFPNISIYGHVSSGWSGGGLPSPCRILLPAWAIQMHWEADAQAVEAGGLCCSLLQGRLPLHMEVLGSFPSSWCALFPQITL